MSPTSQKLDETIEIELNIPEYKLKTNTKIKVYQFK